MRSAPRRCTTSSKIPRFRWRRFSVNLAPVSHIVDGVSKLDQIRTAGVTSAKEETLRKLVVAGGTDWRVFAVKPL